MRVECSAFKVHHSMFLWKYAKNYINCMLFYLLDLPDSPSRPHNATYIKTKNSDQINSTLVQVSVPLSCNKNGFCLRTITHCQGKRGQFNRNKTIIISKSFHPHIVHVYKQSMHIIRVEPSFCHT